MALTTDCSLITTATQGLRAGGNVPAGAVIEAELSLQPLAAADSSDPYAMLQPMLYDNVAGTWAPVATAAPTATASADTNAVSFSIIPAAATTAGRRRAFLSSKHTHNCICAFSVCVRACVSIVLSH